MILCTDILGSERALKKLRGSCKSGDSSTASRKREAWSLELGSAAGVRVGTRKCKYMLYIIVRVIIQTYRYTNISKLKLLFRSNTIVSARDLRPASKHKSTHTGTNRSVQLTTPETTTWREGRTGSLAHGPPMLPLLFLLPRVESQLPTKPMGKESVRVSSTRQRA